MEEKMREKYLSIIDGDPDLFGVAYEIDKYIDKDRILLALIKNNLRGSSLKSCLKEIGVENFDDSKQVFISVKKLVSHIAKTSQTLKVI